MENSITSPVGGTTACLCPDGTYSVECCTGDLQAQGIGSLIDLSEQTVIHENTERTKSVERG